MDAQRPSRRKINNKDISNWVYQNVSFGLHFGELLVGFYGIFLKYFQCVYFAIALFSDESDFRIRALS